MPEISPDDVRQLHIDLVEARSEATALRDALDGDKDAAVIRLYSKVQRQRAQLAVLNGKLARLHFALRIMNRLREPVTAAEWKDVKEGIELEARRKQLGDAAPEAA
jgi:hypothetical protein